MLEPPPGWPSVERGDYGVDGHAGTEDTYHASRSISKPRHASSDRRNDPLASRAFSDQLPSPICPPQHTPGYQPRLMAALSPAVLATPTIFDNPIGTSLCHC